MANRLLVPSRNQQIKIIDLMKSGLEVDWNWYGNYLNSSDPTKARTPEQWKSYYNNLKSRVHNKLKKQTEKNVTVNFSDFEVEVANILMGSSQESLLSSSKPRKNSASQNNLQQRAEPSTSTPNNKQDIEIPETAPTPEMIKWKQLRMARTEKAKVSLTPPPKRRKVSKVPEVQKEEFETSLQPEVQNEENVSMVDTAFMLQMTKTLTSVDASLKRIAGSLERMCQGRVLLNASNANTSFRNANEEPVYMSESEDDFS